LGNPVLTANSSASIFLRSLSFITEPSLPYHLTVERIRWLCDMKLYASIIQRLEKELKIEVNDFLELGLCAFNLEEGNTEEEETKAKRTQKLAIIDSWTNEKIREAKEDQDDYREIDFDSL
jgi:hypothetical protein